MTGGEGGAGLLIQRSVEALFRMDSLGRLLESNEAFPEPAPRLFVARTSTGALCRARHDVPAELAAQLSAAVAGLPPLPETIGVTEVHESWLPCSPATLRSPAAKPDLRTSSRSRRAHSIPRSSSSATTSGRGSFRLL